MPKASHSITTQRSSVATASTDVNSGGLGKIFADFYDEASDAPNWTPEERKAREEACLDKVMAYYKPKDAQFFEETSREIQQNLIRAEAVGVSHHVPTLPMKKKMTAKERVDEVAATLRFG